MRAYRFALRPPWLALHLFAVGVIVTMVLLGRWQLIVSDDKHFSIQNFGYAIQWWVFSVFAALAWWRLMRDRRGRDLVEAGLTPPPPGPPEHEVVAYRRYIAPTTQPASADDDPWRSSYNDYLAALAAEDARTGDTA